jgi:replication-associated recombination protein RarA
MAYQNLVTIRGYQFSEVASALQKSIRRGLEEDSLYWAAELDRSNYGAYVWKRLIMITSEDVGLAEPMLPATIRALYDTWVETKKRKDERNPERMFMVHAVLLLVRAKKSRICDHAKMWAFSDHIEYREIPDVALDKHTLRGKRMGRGFEHFFTEGQHLENTPEDLPDEYYERARALREGRMDEPTNAPQGRQQQEMFAELENQVLVEVP